MFITLLPSQRGSSFASPSSSAKQKLSSTEEKPYSRSVTQQHQASLPKFGKADTYVHSGDAIYNPEPSASARDAFPDVFQVYDKLRKNITQHQNTPDEALEKVASQFREAGHPALFKPVVDQPQFHTRNSNLNKIPLFFSTFGTEIPNPEELKALPPGEKETALIRLIAKRYLNINEDENKYTSFITKYNIGKSSPTMQMQEMPARLIRGEAGTASVNQYSGKYIQDLYNHILKNVQLPANSKSPVTVYVVRPGRDKYATDCSTNFLTLATQGVITDSLNELAKRNGMSGRIKFSDQKQLPGIVRSSRTNATPIERIVLQGYYDTSQIKKGDQVVLADDHCQAGGTLLGMAAAITNRGANVVAAVTPTTHPLCSTFSLAPEVNTLLNETLEKWDPKGIVKTKLAEYGIPMATLTNHEAMIIIAYATDPEDKVAKQKFKTLETTLYQNSHTLSGESDSLGPVLEKKPLTPETIAANMTAASVNARQVTKPVPIKAVHVLDWDDFLSDEKGKNYELMHRAIAVSAHQYGEQYPFLVSLARAMQESQGNYKTGMPKLCMDEQAYSHKTIQNDKATKHENITDLLDHLDQLSPDLKKQLESIPPAEQTHQNRLSDKTLKILGRNPFPEQQPPLSGRQVIDSILWREFKRQYENMLNPNAQKMPTELKHGLKLPFPDIRPTLMPGAKELLEKLRRPENFVVLLSNRPESGLTKELNAMGLAHFFDVTSGKPTILVEENGTQTLSSKKFNKPNPTRLNNIISEQHHLDQATWNFWGDTGKDITQALPLIREGKIPADRVKGFLINPNTELWKKTNEQVKKDLPAAQNVEIIAAKSLLGLPPIGA